MGWFRLRTMYICLHMSIKTYVSFLCALLIHRIGYRDRVFQARGDNPLFLSSKDFRPSSPCSGTWRSISTDNSNQVNKKGYRGSVRCCSLYWHMRAKLYMCNMADLIQNTRRITAPCCSATRTVSEICARQEGIIVRTEF